MEHREDLTRLQSQGLLDAFESTPNMPEGKKGVKMDQYLRQLPSCERAP